MRTTALVLLAGAVTQSAGHATMTQPMSRAWYKKIHGNCVDGGCTEPFSAGGTGGYSPCGKPRGEDFTKLEFELSGLNSQEQAQHTLHAGGVLEIKSLFTAHHLGHVVYAVCPDSSLAGATYGNPPTSAPDCSTVTDPVLKQACNADYLSPLDVYPPAKALMDCFLGEGEWAGGRDGAGMLERSEDHEHLDPSPIDQDHKERWYLPPKNYVLEDGTTGAGWPIGPDASLYYAHYFKVPSNLKCKNGKCLLHFFYWTANSCTGKGYNEYFSEEVAGKGFHPKKQCTGGKCSTVDVRPLGQWTMHGNWWHTNPQYPDGTCDARVTDKPTNTWARQSPERFWNCADVYGPSDTTGGPPDQCAGVQCEVRACESGVCNSATGLCEYYAKAEGTGCFKSGGCGNSDCASAKCEFSQCVCVNKAAGTACLGGQCTGAGGQCKSLPPPPPTTGDVDCEATLVCSVTECSETCGGGTTTRSCVQQVTRQPSGNGKSCNEVAPVGAAVVTACNTQLCPSPGTNNCLMPAAAEWGECRVASDNTFNPPKCCPEGYVCCGTQWFASCRTSCGTVNEQSFAAGKDDGGDSSSSSSKGTLMGLVGLLGGVLCGGLTVFAVFRHRGSRQAAAGAEQL